MQMCKCIPAVVPLTHASSAWLLTQGDWRGIAKHYVPTRTSTQVASHAQKYFLRQLNLQSRKRRSSLFDMAADPDSVRPCPLLPNLCQQMPKVVSTTTWRGCDGLLGRCRTQQPVWSRRQTRQRGHRAVSWGQPQGPGPAALSRLRKVRTPRLPTPTSRMAASGSQPTSELGSQWACWQSGCLGDDRGSAEAQGRSQSRPIMHRKAERELGFIY